MRLRRSLENTQTSSTRDDQKHEKVGEEVLPNSRINTQCSEVGLRLHWQTCRFDKNGGRPLKKEPKNGSEKNIGSGGVIKAVLLYWICPKKFSGVLNSPGRSDRAYPLSAQKPSSQKKMDWNIFFKFSSSGIPKSFWTKWTRLSHSPWPKMGGYVVWWSSESGK